MIGANRYIGSPVERIEDLRFLRGRGEFVGDLVRDGMLGGFKRLSQHHDEGGCDDHSKAAIGSIWEGAIAVPRSTASGRTR